MRRLVTFLIIASSTALGSLWWLHDGDLEQAIEPVFAEWDADLLARNAGVAEDGQAEQNAVEANETP